MSGLRQFRQFVVLAEELNFRRAAKRLFMSQPPLSAAIQRLEHEIGTALLVRSRHVVRLTPAGEAFLKEARRTLAQAQLAIEAAQGAGGGLNGVLRLSFVPSAALELLPEILRRFQRQYPGVRLSLNGDTTERELAALRSGTTDAAIVVPPLPDASGLRMQVLRHESMVLVVPGDHPLIARRKVAIRELASEPFISFPATAGYGFAGTVLAACHRAGFSPRIVQEAAQMQTILTLVASGVGVAFVPAAMRTVHIRNLAYLPVTGPERSLRYDLALASRSDDDNPVLAAFTAVAAEATASLNGDVGKAARRSPVPRAAPVRTATPPASP